jgi:DNA-binding response OmpR family regulator
VLLVEDDPALADVLIDTFQQHGIQTHHATSSESAMTIGREVELDLLLLNLALPAGSGFEVIEWLRQQDRLRHVGVVVYTARDVRDVGVGEASAGGSSARISPEEVRRRVLTLLGRVVPAA